MGPYIIQVIEFLEKASITFWVNYTDMQIQLRKSYHKLLIPGDFEVLIIVVDWAYYFEFLSEYLIKIIHESVSVVGENKRFGASARLRLQICDYVTMFTFRKFVVARNEWVCGFPR